MPAYDGDRFRPPAPVAAITLRNRATAATVTDVLMLIDCGADVTLVPKAIVQQLGIDVSMGREFELVGFDDNTSRAREVSLDLIFLRRNFKGQFLVFDQDYGILGRDVLNHLVLVLDGPALSWREPL